MIFSLNLTSSNKYKGYLSSHQLYVLNRAKTVLHCIDSELVRTESYVYFPHSRQPCKFGAKIRGGIKAAKKYALPAPVAPEQGTAASITATERSDPRRNWRAMDKPMIPAPIITTSKEQDSELCFEPATRSGRYPLLRVLPVEDENESGTYPGSLCPNKLEFEYRRRGRRILFRGDKWTPLLLCLTPGMGLKVIAAISNQCKLCNPHYYYLSIRSLLTTDDEDGDWRGSKSRVTCVSHTSKIQDGLRL